MSNGQGKQRNMGQTEWVYRLGDAVRHDRKSISVMRIVVPSTLNWKIEDERNDENLNLKDALLNSV